MMGWAPGACGKLTQKGPPWTYSCCNSPNHVILLLSADGHAAGKAYRFSGCCGGRGISGFGAGRGISGCGAGRGISGSGRDGVGVLGLSVMISLYTRFSA
jgi:hypothetical protein